MMIMRRVTRQLASVRKKRKPFSLDLIILLIIVGVALTVLLLTHPAYAAAQGEARSAGGSVQQSHTTALAPVQQTAHSAALAGSPSPDCQQFADLTTASHCFDAGQPTQFQNPIAQGSALFYLTPFGSTAGNDQVKFLWSIMLGIVDLFIVSAFMLNGIKIIIAGSIFRYADAVEGIPGMLLALIAAHISMIFIVFFIALNNSLVGGIYVMANKSLTSTPGFTQTKKYNLIFGQDRAAAAQLPAFEVNNDCKLDTKQAQMICQLPVSLVPDNLDFQNLFSNFGDLQHSLDFIGKVLALMLLGQMIIRLFFINFYIIFSPIGIACWALPGKAGQAVTQLWLKGFFSTVMVQFVMVAALIITQVMLGTITKFVGTPDDGGVPVV